MEIRESDNVEAENLVKDGRVKKYIFKPSGRVVWIVVGKRRDYIVMPSADFCSCEDFYFQFNKGHLCYHIIAQKLAEATAVAEEFASKFRRKGVVGIVFLGGIARGYFDKFSDIDLIVFKRRGIRLRIKHEDEIEYKVFKIDYEIVNYDDSAKSEWEMEKRWAFSNAKIFYDPEGKIRALLSKKVHLKNKERKWIIMEGITQSEWYCNCLLYTSPSPRD